MKCSIVARRGDGEMGRWGEWAYWRWILLLSPSLLVSPSAVWACPFCSDAVSTASKHLAKGFYWSILFMLAVVFGVVGAVAAVILRAQRQAAGQSSPRA